MNYGKGIFDPKGLYQSIKWNDDILTEFNVSTIPLIPTQLSQLSFEPAYVNENIPTLYRGHFEVVLPFDTYVDIQGWTQGIIWVNGYNIGRYWNIGPQRTLYAPKDIIQKGMNEIIVLEIDSAPSDLIIGFQDHPIYE